METNSKIFLAGHTGLVGSAIYRNLTSKGYNNIIARDISGLDLTQQEDVSAFFEKEKPEYVILAAAKVGGIMANNIYRAQFIYENMMIQSNVIHHSYLNGVKKLLFLGSSCVYPKSARQPIKEEYLLTDILEYTNEPYAIAKIAGIRMCESYNLQYGTDFISVMPTNLYGPNDNYNLQTSHVLPAMIRKIYLSKCLYNNNWERIRADLKKRPLKNQEGNMGEKEIIELLSNYGIFTDRLILWGSGTPFREFLHVDDMADASIFLLNTYSFKEFLSDKEKTKASEIRNTHINIGTGEEISIKELSVIISDIIDYEGQIVFDPAKPDGTMRKLLDVSKLHQRGWRHSIELKEGIRDAYLRYLNY